MSRISRYDAARYEIESSPWARYLSWKWAQALASRYFAWKVRRKMRRYESREKFAAAIAKMRELREHEAAEANRRCRA